MFREKNVCCLALPATLPSSELCNKHNTLQLRVFLLFVQFLEVMGDLMSFVLMPLYGEIM